MTSRHTSGHYSTMDAADGTQEVTMLCLAVVPRKWPSSGLGQMVSFPMYWVKTHEVVHAHELLIETDIGRALEEILCDPLSEDLWCVATGDTAKWKMQWGQLGWRFFAERQFQPGVTDNLGRTVEEAIGLKGLMCQVASGAGHLFSGLDKKATHPEAIEENARYTLYHPLTERFLVHDLVEPQHTDNLAFPQVKLEAPGRPETIPLCLDDAGLAALSSKRLLALTVEELKAVRTYFESQVPTGSRTSRMLPEWPTDVELEIIAQTWSEHCKHKIFAAEIEHTDLSDPAHPKTTSITSLYKTFIQAPTHASHRPDLLSVFEDNSGVVRWNNEWAVCFKVETHNSPSALEPYGGALTGILGVNRDVLGTGLGAKPIFNTDVFCFAYPSHSLAKRPKLLPPQTIMNGVRRGVQDGGNKSGIPTVNGGIYFHPGYRAKPLVFCGTGGILPTTVHRKSGFKKHTLVGDTIVVVGGRVGKDGIHGATFSSEALHEGSPVSAVQIGDPFMQKRVLDFVVEARDRGLITGITDNGAGGLSSSVGEMARLTNGATIELDQVLLKYPGLSDYEVVISESQERMTISTRSLSELKRLAERYNVEATAIGTFHSKGYFEITRGGKIVALLDLEFLHEGNPRMKLKSHWQPVSVQERLGEAPDPTTLKGLLLAALAHHNICSRENVIRQYDHEVQGGSVIKPLMGPLQLAPCDAAVLRPLHEEDQALVVSSGICPQLSQYDTGLMTVCAVDEAVRNAICVGADPATITLLDNFCWPDPIESERNPDGAFKLGQLVRSCQALAEICTTYNTPLISGKDSMKNDFDDGVVRLSIPPTLLVSAMGKIASCDQAVSMDFKSCGDLIYLLTAGQPGLASTVYAEMQGWTAASLPRLDQKLAIDMYRKLHAAIGKGWVKSCHDLSEGGLAVAISECAIGSGLGANIYGDSVMHSVDSHGPLARFDLAIFAEGPGRLLVSVQPELRQEWEDIWAGHTCLLLGTVNYDETLRFRDHNGKDMLSVPVTELTAAWKTQLPFD